MLNQGKHVEKTETIDVLDGLGDHLSRLSLHIYHLDLLDLYEKRKKERSSEYLELFFTERFFLTSAVADASALQKWIKCLILTDMRKAAKSADSFTLQSHK